MSEDYRPKCGYRLIGGKPVQDCSDPNCSCSVVRFVRRELRNDLEARRKAFEDNVRDRDPQTVYDDADDDENRKPPTVIAARACQQAMRTVSDHVINSLSVCEHAEGRAELKALLADFAAISSECERIAREVEQDMASEG